MLPSELTELVQNIVTIDVYKRQKLILASKLLSVELDPQEEI